MQKTICDMCTLLKYAQNAAIAYSHKTDMPNSYPGQVVSKVVLVPNIVGNSYISLVKSYIVWSTRTL